MSGRAGDRKAQIRCAVYTRKSSEEGLEQDFNSLDAQREACEAYIRSQRHEGWVCLSELYDDGGISGGTLERPALKRLLADIEAGAVDTVVVYKVDRLTRSLSDFAKIVEVFDAHGVSFVAVTQQFNTTTSMGRLTLNMLLSFAQFEREVAGERIRDKIAASKRKGMWMGGLPPLGYDVDDRKLVVNAREAETVRHIYRSYLALGSVFLLQEALDREGLRSKVRGDKHGRRTGGKPLARGALYLMLQNPIYRGRIVHKDKTYPGQHEAIIDETLWAEVQRRLAENRVERATGAGARQPSLLAGLLYDESGARMAPSHADKKGRRYRYYVSESLVSGRRSNAPHGRRVPANDLEGLVEDRLRRFLGSQGEFFEGIEPLVTGIPEAMDLVARAADLAGRWPGLGPAGRRAILLKVIERIDLQPEALEVRIRLAALLSVLAAEDEQAWTRCKEDDAQTVTLTIPARLRRIGKESRLLIEGADGAARRASDHSLHRLLAQAHRYNEMVMRGSGKTIAQLATEAGVCGSYFSRVLRLSFLAPEIVEAVLGDRHPLALSAKHLTLRIRLAAAWDEQREVLGLD